MYTVQHLIYGYPITDRIAEEIAALEMASEDWDWEQEDESGTSSTDRWHETEDADGHIITCGFREFYCGGGGVMGGYGYCGVDSGIEIGPGDGPRRMQKEPPVTDEMCSEVAEKAKSVPASIKPLLPEIGWYWVNEDA